MKFGIALAGMALTLFAATTAQAQLTITLSPASPVNDPAFPGYTQYYGTITNPTGSPITVDGDNLNGYDPTKITFFNTLAGAFPTDPNSFDPSKAALTFDVPAFGAYTSSPGGAGDTTTPLFELLVDPSTPLTALTFTLSSQAGGTLGSVEFQVGTADVPEPGSVALLASSLVGGSLLMARRRRK